MSFFVDATIGVLTINGRINFLQLARYCKSCEQRFRQNFRKKFDWISFNQNFVQKQSGHRYAIAIDPSFISKSGKHTPGISYFWSGCAQSMKRGLEILGVALVDVDTHDATAIRAVQTIKGSRSQENRPECVKLLAINTYREQLLELSDTIVADAFFSKGTFVQGLDILGFNLVSRFRDDVRLRYLYAGERTGGKGRPKQYDGIVNLDDMRDEVFQKQTLMWDNQEVIVRSTVVNAVSLKKNVKVVIVDFEDSDKKAQTRKIFFSTNCEMSAQDVIDIYRSRFQIEFLFRDAKQFTGLNHCQARNEQAMDFAFNLSLAAINVAKAFAKEQNLNLSIADSKLLMHNAMMIQRFLSAFGEIPNPHKNQGLKEHYFKELMLFGLKSAV